MINIMRLGVDGRTMIELILKINAKNLVDSVKDMNAAFNLRDP